MGIRHYDSFILYIIQFIFMDLLINNKISTIFSVKTAVMGKQSKRRKNFFYDFLRFYLIFL